MPGNFPRPRTRRRARRSASSSHGRVRIEARALGRLQQLALVPLAGGMRPRLHRAAAEAQRAVGHHQRLVVLEDVAEALALAARAERMVEREEQRLRPLERGAARAAAEGLGEHAAPAVDQLDRDLAAALAQRGLQRFHQAAALRARRARRGRARPRSCPPTRSGGGAARSTLHAVHQHAGEAAAGESGPQLGGRLAGRHRQREGDERARAGVLAQQRVGDGLRRVGDGGGAARGTVDAADLRVEQAQVVVDLGGGAHRRARGADRILLLERHRRPHVLDAIHVGPIDPVEEHARVRRERFDVAPLALGEQRVEGERGLAGAGDAGDDGEPIVRDLEGDVLEVVLAGSLDTEPRGSGHSRRPPEMESLLEEAT